jgi:hypothetical protein
MSWSQVMQAAVMWGPGILILAGIFMLVRKPPEFVGEFIEAQKGQAVAMSSMAEAVNRVSAQRDELGQEVLRTLTKLEINDIAILRELDVIRRSGCARVPGEDGTGGRDA